MATESNRDLRADVGGNNCKGLGIAAGREFREGSQVMRQEAQAGTGRHRPGQADQVPC